MHVRIVDGRSNGFAKRSHPASNDNDNAPGGATPIALREPPSDREALEEPAHRPWFIPGVGGSF
jgi:hypothetical protein